MSETVDIPRPLRADARRNRERIIRSARKVFARDGVEAQMDDVARDAGVGVGTLYRHFPTKEALLVELVREKLTAFTAILRGALTRDGESGAVFREAISQAAMAASCDAGMQELMAGLDGEPWAELADEQRELDAATEELIDRARLAGAVRADLTSSDVGMLMCGLGAAMHHAKPGFDWRRHLELALDAMGPAAGATRADA